MIVLYEGGPCPVCGEALLKAVYALRCSNGGCVNHTRAWYYAEKRLSGGRIAHVTPIGAMQGRLTAGSEAAFRGGLWGECWDYPTIEVATEALAEWDGEGDPPNGWTRQIPSGRRRPDGDPAREFVRP